MKKRLSIQWNNLFKASVLPHNTSDLDAGFAMPMAIALGLCMLAIATTSMLLAQDGRDSAALRQENASSLLVSDSAIAEILTVLSTKRNSVLLGKNYDPINPRTGNPYLGPDGIPNTDDGTEAVDEWSTVNPYACQPELGLSGHDDIGAFSNPLGPDSNYEILAYRYDPENQAGYLLVEGTHNGISSNVHITLDIAHNSQEFPGVLVDSIVYWQGRELTGRNGNVYFNPTDDEYPTRLQNLGLESYAPPSDGERQSYLNMLWSGTSDGFVTDPIEGNLVACDFNFAPTPPTPVGKDLGSVETSQDLSGTIGGKNFQANSIELDGSEEIQVDTTDGPVHIYVKGITRLRDNARIRNYRTDGRPPRVGDLHIIQTATEDAPVELNGTTCIENAFVYSPQVDVHLYTTGSGCPGPSESNILGVVWAEDIENSTVSDNDFDGGGDWEERAGIGTITATSGIEIPDDVSSLVQELKAIDFPVYYRISGVTSWNNVSL